VFCKFYVLVVDISFFTWHSSQLYIKNCRKLIHLNELINDSNLIGESNDSKVRSIALTVVTRVFL